MEPNPYACGVCSVALDLIVIFSNKRFLVYCLKFKLLVQNEGGFKVESENKLYIVFDFIIVKNTRATNKNYTLEFK